MFNLKTLQHSAYLSRKGYEHLLESQLKEADFEKLGLLFWVKSPHITPRYWIDQIWSNLHLLEFKSIKECSQGLRSLQRNWWPCIERHPRRHHLIQDALPHVSARPLQFFEQTKASLLGSYTLIDKNLALLSAQCSSSRPNGQWEFVENKEDPPNRAYLKLWEVFSRTQHWPNASERVLDLGASPGGWTWVLSQQLKCFVFALDSAPLRDDLMASQRVLFNRADGLALSLDNYKDVEWLFSDMACPPDKLLEFIRNIVLPSSIKYAVCTIKLQGEDPQLELLDAFIKLPRSQVLWLTANKHEVTYLYGFPALKK